MIYDWTDDIFAWKGWHVIKWIFGALLAIGIVYLIWQLNVNNNIQTYFLSLIHNLRK